MTNFSENRSNAELVEALKANGSISATEIEDAFLSVDRANFVGINEEKLYAYYDRALPIGHEQTISQPTVVAFMLAVLKVEVGQKVLDVGSGSGWTTALLAHLVGPKGSVIGVERITELTAFGQNNLRRQKVKNATIVTAGPELGYSRAAPYDRVLVSAESEKIPWSLVSQVKKLGKMVLPLDGKISVIELGDNGPEMEQYELPVAFVPLIEDAST